MSGLRLEEDIRETRGRKAECKRCWDSKEVGLKITTGKTREIETNR